MTFILYLLYNLLIPLSAVEDHAIYLSTVTVSVEGETVAVVIKVFEDDLRDAIHGQEGIPVDTSSQYFVTAVNKYFEHHFKLDGKGLIWKGQVSNIERVGDSYQIRFEPSAMVVPDQVGFQADYFMELFPTQQNILDLRIGERKFYHIFKKGSPTTIIDITR